MVHDGKIVRSQVPNDADGHAEKTQVHPPRIVVVQITRARCHSARGFFEPHREQKCVIHHDFRFLRAANSMSSDACAEVEVNGFCHEYMFPMLEGCVLGSVMSPHGRKSPLWRRRWAI